MNTPKKMALSCLAAMLACIGSLPAWAVDGVVLIDQNKALAGNVTPGDAPGYPVTLSVAGSYKLAGNLTVASADDTGVFITANNVTLDLNGFSIIGQVTCTDVGTAITCSSSGQGNGVVTGGYVTDVVVQNGHVQGMGRDGINIAEGGLVRGVVARSNALHGIFVGASVLDSRAEYNGDYGIIADLIEHSHASHNGGNGFATTGLLTHSVSARNKRYGLSCSGNGSYLGNTFSENRSANQIDGCVGRNAGGNVCNGYACPP